MKLKRYTNEELKELLPKIFFEYMTNGGVEKVRGQILDRIKSYTETKNLYESELSKGNLEELTVNSIREQLEYIDRGLDLISNSNIENQKRIYEQTGSIDFCRTVVQIPLNKKINSFYDDLILEVVFYDNVCTYNGKYDDYKAIESEEDVLEFLMRNIEITHIGLVYERNSRRVAILQVIGDLNVDDGRVKNSGTELLSSKFSDFENLTLSDTSEIRNNDIKQWIQSKIDLDKENMKELARVFIRGDYYSIHKPENSDDLYIRYVCRSTGRVYYNTLKLSNLKLSEYYKEGDYESYAKAWWNLTHLGSKVDGEPIIAC